MKFHESSKEVSHTAIWEEIPKTEDQVIKCQILKDLDAQGPAADQVIGLEYREGERKWTGVGSAGYCENFRFESLSKLRDMFTHLNW